MSEIKDGLGYSETTGLDAVDNEGEVLTEVVFDSVNLGDFSMDDDDGEVKIKKPEKVSKVEGATPLPKGDIGFDGDDEDILSSSEKLRLYSDKVISCLVGKKDVCKYARTRLLGVTRPELFRDENYILFSILSSYRDKIKRINIDEEFIQLYLYRNRKLINSSKTFINIHAYGDVDGQEDLAYISGVIKHFNRLCVMEELTEEDFETFLEKYLIEFKASEAQKIYAQGAMILNDGLQVGKRKLIGFEDSANYIKRRLADLEGLVDMNVGAGFVSMNDVLRDEVNDGRKHEKIGDFDHLTALTDVYGGIFTGLFYQIIAPPKAGKTKFCTRVCHTVSVKFGHNVSVWAQEGGKEAWTAQMRAIHFDYTYNTDSIDQKDRKFGIDQDVILKGVYPDQKLKELELSSKLDLDSNPEYGKVQYIDRPFEVETFIEDIDTSVKENGSKLVIIDYLQLIGSSTGVSERERIADAYKRLLVYCKKNNVAVLVPGQYTQNIFNEMRNLSDISNVDMRTSAGGSAEVIRTPDIVFALWASTQDLLNNEMKIVSMPCRFAKPFPNISVYADLSVCDFISYET